MFKGLAAALSLGASVFLSGCREHQESCIIKEWCLGRADAVYALKQLDAELGSKRGEELVLHELIAPLRVSVIVKGGAEPYFVPWPHSDYCSDLKNGRLCFDYHRWMRGAQLGDDYLLKQASLKVPTHFLGETKHGGQVFLVEGGDPEAPAIRSLFGVTKLPDRDSLHVVVISQRALSIVGYRFPKSLSSEARRALRYSLSTLTPP